MGRAKKRADRIREEVPLDTVLARYGYDIIEKSDREQQFSCDLHGDGSDNKPSARYYPDSSSWYCFACSKSRDAISTVMSKEGLSFSEACTSLERDFGLPALPWEDDDRPKRIDSEIEVDTPLTPQEISGHVLKTLKSFSVGKDIPIDSLLRLWEAHDKLVFLHQEGHLTVDQIKEGMARIAKTAMRVAREQALQE